MGQNMECSETHRCERHHRLAIDGDEFLGHVKLVVIAHDGVAVVLYRRVGLTQRAQRADYSLKE